MKLAIFNYTSFVGVKINIKTYSKGLIALVLEEIPAWQSSKIKNTPYQKKTWALLRSSHVHSKSRNTYERRTYRAYLCFSYTELYPMLRYLNWLQTSFSDQVQFKFQLCFCSKDTKLETDTKQISCIK